jgi:hypothetical protein
VEAGRGVGSGVEYVVQAESPKKSTRKENLRAVGVIITNKMDGAFIFEWNEIPATDIQ